VAAHGYFGRLIFQYASFNNSRSLHFFLAAWPVVGIWFTALAVLEGAAGSPPFQGELMLMLIGYFGLTLLHAQKEGSYV